MEPIAHLIQIMHLGVAAGYNDNQWRELAMVHCPGQDLRYWKPKDIFEEPCAHCGGPVEFFKDDLRRKCPHCSEFTVNPRNDMACAAWCKHAEECLAQLGGAARQAPDSAEADED